MCWSWAWNKDRPTIQVGPCPPPPPPCHPVLSPWTSRWTLIQCHPVHSLTKWKWIRQIQTSGVNLNTEGGAERRQWKSQLNYCHICHTLKHWEMTFYELSSSSGQCTTLLINSPVIAWKHCYVEKMRLVPITWLSLRVLSLPTLWGGQVLRAPWHIQPPAWHWVLLPPNCVHMTEPSHFFCPIDFFDPSDFFKWVPVIVMGSDIYGLECNVILQPSSPTLYCWWGGYPNLIMFITTLPLGLIHIPICVRCWLWCSLIGDVLVAATATSGKIDWDLEFQPVVIQVKNKLQSIHSHL